MPHADDKPVAAGVILLLTLGAYVTDAEPLGEIRIFCFGIVYLNSKEIKK
jgi:hypothetical protein